MYGEYNGEVGSFMNWQGCTTAGLAWEQANYNMATDNVVKFSTGLGAAAYWFAAGPGRDPHYNGTAAEAAIWGQKQAQQALSDLGGKVFDFRYIFMDIENNGVPPDEDGWKPDRWPLRIRDRLRRLRQFIGHAGTAPRRKMCEPGTTLSILYGTARIEEGGAADLLRRLARVYIGPDTTFPPDEDPGPGWITRITPTGLGGAGPWSTCGTSAARRSRAPW